MSSVLSVLGVLLTVITLGVLGSFLVILVFEALLFCIDVCTAVPRPARQHRQATERLQQAMHPQPSVEEEPTSDQD